MLICNAVLTDADGARPGDVRIENGVITAVGEGLSAGGDTVLDAGGRTLLPAFIDLHCHFRTPGFEYKEDIDSGSRAAARGGYTFVNCMANTRPVCSSAAIAQSIMDDGQAHRPVRREPVCVHHERLRRQDHRPSAGAAAEHPLHQRGRQRRAREQGNV